MEYQRGIAPRYFAGATITAAIDANGVGKAVIFDTGVDEVIECTEAGYQKFAGIIQSVDAEATVTRSNASVNQGARNVAEGDAVGVVNDHFVEVLVSGAVGFGDFLTTDDGGKLQKLTISATPTAEEIFKIVGRSMGIVTDEEGGSVKAHVWVRK